MLNSFRPVSDGLAEPHSVQSVWTDSIPDVVVDDGLDQSEREREADTTEHDACHNGNSPSSGKSSFSHPRQNLFQMVIKLSLHFPYVLKCACIKTEVQKGKITCDNWPPDIVFPRIPCHTWVHIKPFSWQKHEGWQSTWTKTGLATKSTKQSGGLTKKQTIVRSRPIASLYDQNQTGECLLTQNSIVFTVETVLLSF